uniref:Attacin_C domain-containing protein n=1 Tax=Ascaris lumbricoides TaxID=6252 RepID=A0A0M3IBA6_ASCLU
MRSASLLVLLCCVLLAFSAVNAELSAALIRSKRHYGGYYKKATLYGPGGVASRTVARGPYGRGYSKTSVLYGKLSAALIRSKRHYGGYYKKATLYGPGGVASRTVARGPYGRGYSKTSVLYGK